MTLQEKEDINSFHEMYLETLGAWALFRSFGYPAEEIFLMLTPVEGGDPPVVQVGILLNHNGIEAAIKICVTDVPVEKFKETWKEASETYNQLSPYYRKRLFDKTRARKATVQVIQAMRGLGLGCTPKQIQERDEAFEGVPVENEWVN